MALPARLTTHAGRVVVLTAVAEIAPDQVESQAGIRLTLEIEDGPVVRDELAAYAVSFQHWAEDRGSDGRPIGAPPPQPAEFLNELEITISDDVGTTYVAGGRHAGGSGSERVGAWLFSPRPPAEATRIMILGPDTRRAVRRAGAGGWM